MCLRQYVTIRVTVFAPIISLWMPYYWAIYIEQKVVWGLWGAEFRAETQALCSRVKSRNTLFPEHYPHMPTQHVGHRHLLHKERRHCNRDFEEGWLDTDFNISSLQSLFLPGYSRHSVAAVECLMLPFWSPGRLPVAVRSTWGSVDSQTSCTTYATMVKSCSTVTLCIVHFAWGSSTFRSKNWRMRGYRHSLISFKHHPLLHCLPKTFSMRVVLCIACPHCILLY